MWVTVGTSAGHGVRLTLILSSFEDDMLRTLFVFTVVSAAAATPTLAAAVGDACTGATKDANGAFPDPGFGDHCGTDGQLQFCDTTGSTANPPTGTVKEQDCTLPDPTDATKPHAAPTGVC